ncbi:hypothetical protein NUW58_g8745 [Xylaria curta]|uniref:Uncharacterized protein n=1 Tax=Xylaria curta TaxID=42375 RepID=A0ACC1N6W0_9PEZI|nr:hypothetical protein NUW58_g8745 [Xylaria curta]
MATTTNLKRKASRWQLLPTPGDEDSLEVEVDSGKYSLLLFLRDLDATQSSWDEFIESLKNAPGALDEKTTIAAILEAALHTTRLGYDYTESTGPDAKRRRVDLLGNDVAGTQLAEYSELIHLARTVWPDPTDLGDFLGRLYQFNLRQVSATGEDRFPLSDIFEWARSWSEARYRFLNHTLRDDPSQFAKYDAGRCLTKGMAANGLIHNSDVLTDSKMVEFQLHNNRGFSPQDRGIYEELYLLTPEEGQKLAQYSGTVTGLRAGLPQVFRYTAAYINAYIDWRIKVLDSARKQIISSQAFRAARTPMDKHNVKARMYPTYENQLRSVDSGYVDLLPHLRKLLKEAENDNAFNRRSYDEFENALSRMTASLRRSPMNTCAPDLANNVRVWREYGSEGLDELIEKEGKGYFADADAVCISDNYWLGTEKPCLTYGLRGCNYYSVEISGPGADLHSGVFGGTAQEPMTDLVRVLGSLVDTNGKIQIPGIYEQVAPVTSDEEGLYDGIAFTMETLHESLGSTTTIFEDKRPTLMARWRHPSLSVHGIEGAFSAPGAKTVIPAKVIGKFSIRTLCQGGVRKTQVQELAQGLRPAHR